MALPALLATQIAATRRTKAQLAGNLRDIAIVDVAAYDAAREAVFYLPAAGVGRLPAATARPAGRGSGGDG